MHDSSVDIVNFSRGFNELDYAVGSGTLRIGDQKIAETGLGKCAVSPSNHCSRVTILKSPSKHFIPDAMPRFAAFHQICTDY